MSKGDFPALRMVVENGRLAPATPFDQERINSYRRGAIVMCKLNDERDRVLVRKWWAILSLVIKQCQTPWKTKEEASEAVKLALGIVNLSKTVGGAFMQYPKSLTELDDPEMTEALENMIELLSRITGVDVETLRKEAADVGPSIEPDQPNTGEPLSSSVEAGDIPAPANEAGDDPAPSPASTTLGTELRTHLMDFARKASRTVEDENLSAEAKASAIETMIANYRDALPEADWPKLATIKVSMQAVLAGKRSIGQARDFIARDLLECTVSEIGG